MQSRTDGTSGYFNDVPYFSPVETAVFYEAVQSCRLHRLPAHLMVKPRSIPFFADTDSALARALVKAESERKGKGAKEGTALLPEFMADYSARQMLFHSSGRDYVVIREVCEIFDASAVTASSSTVDIGSLSTEAIGLVWTGLLLFLNGCQGSVGRFVLHNVDTLCRDSCGSNDFLVSLLLAGVASILHYYSQTGDRDALLGAVSLELTVLNTDSGSCIADNLQYFVEKNLKVTVSRSREGVFLENYEELFSAARYVGCTADEWVELVCSEVVDAHETLCDTVSGASATELCSSPTVLLIVPQAATLRAALEKQILDSYSTEPLRVQREDSWTHAELSKAAPLVFLCSSRWLVEQASAPKGHRLLHRLNVQIVIHGGCCEVGDFAEEELVRSLVVLKSAGLQWEEMRVMQHEEPSYWHAEKVPSFRSESAPAQQSANALLLLFRRFVTPYSPSTRQPFTAIPSDLFCSRRAGVFYREVAQTLRLAGILAPETTASPQNIELTVVGRLLSYRYRVGELSLVDDTLTVADGKTILWAFLFRQSREVPRDLIKGRYPFHAWVDAAVASFCKVHRLDFDTEGGAPRAALVEQLALFGVGGGGVRDRVHHLLSSPSGVRLPVESHLVAPAPTVCRGWYEQAPLSAGLALEKKEVSVFCLPPQAAYCELRGVEGGASGHIQCPLELTYPLLVTHSVLHISLHNMCVFGEAANPTVVTPLPTSLVDSVVMSNLLSGDVGGKAGFWLDGAMSESALTTSASSVLASLTLKGRQLIAHCERELFTRKRRRAEAVASKSESADAFHGTRPRTAAERSAVEELAELIKTIGRERAERAVRGKKGFGFLEPSHELHPFYLFNLKS
ncbi:hypothetical protein NESM_000800600 [Novymonas esmeraldas]|uniref:Uncharacterized protein n=1 Tax=Novymonas esmeraldas TaxID=1808958 RepID=A0AAW0EYP8_9TRYP